MKLGISFENHSAKLGSRREYFQIYSFTAQYSLYIVSMPFSHF